MSVRVETGVAEGTFIRSASLLDFSKVKFGSLHRGIKFGTKPTGNKFRVSSAMTNCRTVQFICLEFTV